MSRFRAGRPRRPRLAIGAFVALAAIFTLPSPVLARDHQRHGGTGGRHGAHAQVAGVTKQPFGTADGKPVDLYTLTNGRGLEVKIITYGGIVQSIRTPDRH